MTIQDIYQFEDISLRSFNICNNNGLRDKKTLLEFYREHQNFTKLRNCGKKCNRELIALCLKYLEAEIGDSTKTVNEAHLAIENKLSVSPLQIEVINRYIKTITNKLLSKRSLEAILSILNGSMSFENLQEKILNNEHFHISEIKYLRPQTAFEVNDFLTAVRNLVKEVTRLGNENTTLILPNRTLQEIYQSEDISVRSFNVCNDNSINDLYDLLRHYRENKSFVNLRNCGRKSNDELTAVCSKYIEIQDLYKLQNEENLSPVTPTNHELTLNQRETIIKFIDITTKQIRPTSLNALLQRLGSNSTIENIYDIILKQNASIPSLLSFGKKSSSEISTFFRNITQFAEIVKKITDNNKLAELANRHIIQHYSSVSEIPSNILESQSIFKITNFLIKQETIFHGHQSTIFHKSINIFDDHHLFTRKQIAEDLNLTKERVRQLTIKTIDEFYSKFQYINYIEDDILQNYEIDITKDYILIDHHTQRIVNEINQTNFSIAFISYVLSIYCSKSHQLVGKAEEILQSKSSSSQKANKANCFQLVRKEISEDFDFESFLDDVECRLNERIEETYCLNFNAFVSRFSRNHHDKDLEAHYLVAEKLIGERYGIYLNLNDEIEFTRNTTKQLPEYALETLDKLGKPTKLQEIVFQLENDYPELIISPESLRATLHKSNEIIHFGRSGTYGLKKWELENQTIRGGSIRKIVLDYLASSLEPKHISEIVNHVLQFRPDSNLNSIITNLKLENSGSFIFFENCYIGAWDKQYNQSYKVLDNNNATQRKTWEKQYSNLLQFIQANKRLPFSISNNNAEVQLYRWYRVQIGRCNKREIEDEKAGLIRNIYHQVSTNTTFNKRKANNWDKYDALIQFIKENARLPAANRDGESTLYQFFYKKRKLFQRGNLEKQEEEAFVKITTLLNSMAYEKNRR